MTPPDGKSPLSQEWHVQSLLRQSPHLSEAQARQIVRHVDLHVRLRLLWHAAGSPQDLSQFAQNKDVMVVVRELDSGPFGQGTLAQLTVT